MCYFCGLVLVENLFFSPLTEGKLLDLSPTYGSYYFFFIRCLCSVSKMSGKGAAVVEQLIQFFFKCLDTQAVDNKQVYCKIHVKIYVLISTSAIGFYSPAIPSNVFQLIENLKLYAEIIE